MDSSSKPEEEPKDEAQGTLGSLGSGWEAAMADIVESGSGASAPSASASDAAPMDEGEPATSPTAAPAPVDTTATTTTTTTAAETATLIDFFDDQPPALSPTQAPLSPTPPSVFDDEPELQLSPNTNTNTTGAPALLSMDLSAPTLAPPSAAATAPATSAAAEHQPLQDPWAALVSTSTESEVPMDEAVGILSSQPPASSTPVQQSAPVPKPAVEEAAPKPTKPVAPVPAPAPVKSAPVSVPVSEPAPMAAPVEKSETQEPVVVAPSEPPATESVLTTPSDEHPADEAKTKTKPSIDGDEPTPVDVNTVPSDEAPETPMSTMESAHSEPEKAPSLDEAATEDEDDEVEKTTFDEKQNIPNIQSVDSKLSSASGGDLSDYVNQFTKAKPSMDDLDDILGPMKDDDPSLLEKLDGDFPSTPMSPSIDKSADLLFAVLSDVSGIPPPKPKVEDNNKLLEASQKQVEGLTANKAPKAEPFFQFTTPGLSLAEMQQKKQASPAPMPSPAPAPMAAPPPPPDMAPPAPPVEEDAQDEEHLDRIVASLAKMSPMGRGQQQQQQQQHVAPVLAPAVVAQKPPPSTPPAVAAAASGSTLGDASFRTSPSGTVVSVLSKDSESFWSASNSHQDPLAKPSLSEGMPDIEENNQAMMATRKQAPAPVSTSHESSDNEPIQGGRLWEAAQLEATEMETRPTTPEALRFAESIMARTRSRADPNAVISGSPSMDRADADRPTMIRIGENDDTFILNTALARKRVRVVQLLLVGLIGLLVAFLGGIYVQSSCHFVSAQVEVGQNAKVFSLHYGLWKYTPMDSVFQGYSYCYQYDDKYTNDAPMFPRWASCIALVGGAFSLSILWFYLIFGRAAQRVWRAAVISAGLSGILQLCTLVFFIGDVCQRDVCTLGPAGILSVVASCVWFILAFEMHYNTPMTAWVADLPTSQRNQEEPGTLVSNLEMTDFEDGAKAYVRRLVKGDAANPYEYPTLNQIQRDNDNPIGEAMLDRDLTTPRGTYKPPQVLV